MVQRPGKPINCATGTPARGHLIVDLFNYLLTYLLTYLFLVVGKITNASRYV